MNLPQKEFSRKCVASETMPTRQWVSRPPTSEIKVTYEKNPLLLHYPPAFDPARIVTRRECRVGDHFVCLTPSAIITPG